MKQRQTRRRRGRAALAISVALALLISACGDDDTSDQAAGGGGETSTSTAPSPVSGGNATALLVSETASLDPVRLNGTGGGDGHRGFALYGALVTLDPTTSTVKPVLAESFTPSTDLLTWTLKLKPGIVFTDGTSLDAEAVRFNWARVLDPANRSPSLSALAGVKQMTVTDAATLTITLAAPNAHFDKAIGRVGANFVGSPTAISAGTDLTSTAVGAGPFVLDEWLRDDRMVLSANPNWKGSDGPYLETLTLRVVGSEDQRVDTFNTGAADAFYTSAPASVLSAQRSNRDAEYANVEVPGGQSMVFNTSKPPFNDLRARKAFVQGVDWSAMVDSVFGEGSKALETFVSESSPWYVADAKFPAYDTAAAQKLIDEYVAANGGVPLAITISAFQQATQTAAAKFIQTSLSQLKNIKVEVEINDSTTAVQKVRQAEFMVSSWGLPHVDPEPGLYLVTFSASSTNYSKYKNDKVDAALAEGRATLDPAQRKPIYASIYRTLAEDLPYFPYVKTVNGFVTSPDLHGGEVYEDGVMRWDLLWLKS